MTTDPHRADMPVPEETWEAFRALATPCPLPALYEQLLAHPELVDPVTLDQIESRLHEVGDGQALLNILAGMHEARRIGIARFMLGLHMRSAPQDHLAAVYMKVHLPEAQLPESIRAIQHPEFLAEVKFLTRLLHDADDHDRFGAMTASPAPPLTRPPGSPTEEQRREKAWTGQFPGLNAMLTHLFTTAPQHWTEGRDRLYRADQVLARLDRRAVPFTWAAVQRVRAETLLSGGFGDRDQNYAMAAEALRQALAIFVGSPYKGDLAMLRVSLAQVLMGETGPDRAFSIEEALACYEAAERDVPAEASPHLPAVIQHAWGIALRDRIEGDRLENLRQARLRIARAQALFAAIRVMPPQGELAIRMAAHDHLMVLRDLAANSDDVSGDDLAAAEYEAERRPLPGWMKQD